MPAARDRSGALSLISGTRFPGALQAPESCGDGEARVLLRVHGESLEFVQIPLKSGGVEVEALRNSMSPAGRALLARHLRADEVEETAMSSRPTVDPMFLHATPASVRVSVVVCTRDRGAELRECLLHLKALTYDDIEVLIVDNAPTDGAGRTAFAAEVGTDSRFRYLVEPRPGLSWARNRGLAEASGDIIAYTDDDVRVDKGWVSALVAGFERRPDIACVTSLVCTASLQTPSEHYFDARVSWARSCEPQIYDHHAPVGDSLFPYSPGLFGTGAGMAFRTAVIRDLGGFDVALGAGTKSAGGEDLDAFVRVLQGGYALAYEPSSIVWHHHRADLAALSRQMYSYGTGLTAFMTKHLANRSTRWPLLRRLPRGVAKVMAIPSATRAGMKRVEVPSRLLLLREFAGMAAGPALYAMACVEANGHRSMVADGAVRE